MSTFSQGTRCIAVAIVAVSLSACVSTSPAPRSQGAADAQASKPQTTPKVSESARAANKPAPRTREGLANSYGTANDSYFNFELILRKDGSALMQSYDMDAEKTHKYPGTWSLQNDRITVLLKIKGKTNRYVYKVRDSLTPVEAQGCRGSFGLEAVTVAGGEAVGDYHVWPSKALKAEQAPCARR